LAFHPYPQLIPQVFNPGGSGPPHGLTRASPWPWVDHPASGPHHATRRPLQTRFRSGYPTHGLTSPRSRDSQAHSSKGTPSHRKNPRSDGLQAHGFRNSFTPLPGYFSPFPHGTQSTIGHQEVFRLSEWSRQIHSTLHGNAATREHGHTTPDRFHLQGSHPLRPHIPARSANNQEIAEEMAVSSSHAPQHHTRNPCQVSHAHGLASSAFARHYSRNHKCFLLLRVLRCFTSPRSPQHPIHSGTGNPASPGLGYPIRTPSDHSSAGNSPRLIAATHVLHRPLVPRHPPCALHNFTHKNQDMIQQNQRITATRCSHPLYSSQTTTTPEKTNTHTRAPVLSGPNSVFSSQQQKSETLNHEQHHAARLLVVSP
jgi:hypothetical protein